MSWIYAVGVICRNACFDWGILKSTVLRVPVISVGNITAGGTGKTPLVEYVVGYCLRKKKRVAVVSRGYGRSSRGVVVVSDGQSMLADARRGGDEAVQVARKFPEAVVVVGERRVEAARAAVDTLRAEVIVMDDGFQHRYLHRNLDIVLLDARKDIATEGLLPLGRRREPLAALRRAGVIVLSKVDARAPTVPWQDAIARWHSAPLVTARLDITGFRLAGEHSGAGIELLTSRKTFAFSGIGDHDGFILSLKQAGLTVVRDEMFPDHHLYNASDVERIVDGVRSSGAEQCVTTEKDMARLSADADLAGRLRAATLLYFATAAVDIVQGREIFWSMIDTCLKAKAV
jgi:tetraacyldisaccharide 4'-kinase